MTQHPRLSADTLDRLAPSVRRPAYDRAELRRGVVHLGIGAFHRAHQAAVFDDCCAAGDLRWGVTGVSLRSAGVRDQLVPQDGLYTLAVRDGAETEDRLIGVVSNVLVAPQDPGAVVAAIAARDTHLVTLTITEKGYKLDPASGALMLDDADIAADLAQPHAPRTAPALLVAGLARRRDAGLSPISILSCDNLSHNGAKLREAVLGFARATDPALADWIADHAAFPETMVDRIVPATTDDDIAATANRIGLVDHGHVKTEPFLQWVVEDRFAGERPDLAAAGVQLTGAVAPWEEAKLRLLNGAHSALSYFGALAGCDFVHQVVARPGGRALVEALWDEAQDTLSPPPELDLAAYRSALIARFSNAALQHRTRQIAMDGSQKLPQRLLATASARLEAGRSIDTLALGVAAWMRWVTAGADEAGAAIRIDDPLADRLTAATQAAGTAEARAAALLRIRAVFPGALADDPRFARPVCAALERLEAAGARALLDPR